MGPTPAKTSTSPARMWPALMAVIASRSRVNTRAGPSKKNTPSGDSTAGSMEVLLMTAPSGAKLPRGKVTVLVRPRSRAKAGGRITESGSTPSNSCNRWRSTDRRSDRAQASKVSPSRSPVAVSASRSSNPRSRKCSITSGTPPAKKARTVGWWVGPLGITLTRRGVRRLMAIQSSTVGRRRPAAWAMAGMCSNKLVEPPKAA